MSLGSAPNTKKQILSFMSSEESERYWVSLSFPFIKHGLRGEDHCRRTGTIIVRLVYYEYSCDKPGPIVNIFNKDLDRFIVIRSHCLKDRFKLIIFSISLWNVYVNMLYLDLIKSFVTLLTSTLILILFLRNDYAVPPQPLHRLSINVAVQFLLKIWTFIGISGNDICQVRNQTDQTASNSTKTLIWVNLNPAEWHWFRCFSACKIENFQLLSDSLSNWTNLSWNVNIFLYKMLQPR